ncbi:MAG: DUF3866 family protein [Solirubrobacterales bacterium]
MLKLRRGSVVSIDPLVVEVAGERRRAWVDERTIGQVAEGDEVIVNVEALDLALGSGGFDVIHANLTRGLDDPGSAPEHVMKLNYTSLQHPVAPIEVQVRSAESDARSEAEPRSAGAVPVLVLPLHGHLAPAAWAARQAAPELKLGFVQTAGGALPGGLSRDIAELRGRGLLSGDITAGPCHGGSLEAISLPGAIDAGRCVLGWDAVLVGPGPGIIGSDSRLGHGGMAALDSAHAALALGAPTLISPRLSSGDSRPRHRGLSHHTATVLQMLLADVRVVVPSLEASERATIGGADASEAIEQVRAACGERHELVAELADLDGYAATELSSTTMGRGIDEDRLFFAAALAAGRALAQAATRSAEAG